MALDETETARLKPFYSISDGGRGYILCFKNATLFGMEGKMFYLMHDFGSDGSEENTYLRSWFFVANKKAEYSDYQALLKTIEKEYPKGVCAENLKANGKTVEACTIWDINGTNKYDACGYYSPAGEGIIYLAYTDNIYEGDRNAGSKLAEIYLERLSYISYL